MTGNIGNKDFKMKTSFTNLEKILKKRIGNALYNTSYPLSPEDWKNYSKLGNFAMDVNQPMAFYIHIPFCCSRCSFCEYTIFSYRKTEDENSYMDIVQSDINKFLDLNNDITLYGFDIGGGTPTALKLDNFKVLMNLYENIMNRVETTPDFEPSIEASFESLGRRRGFLFDTDIEEQKIKEIYKTGFRRVSLGMKSTTISQLGSLRPLSESWSKIEEKRNILNCLKNNGIEKINLDLMYGMEGQNIDTLNQDLDILAILFPEQVTLYELRRNQIRDCDDREGKNIRDYHEVNFSQYEILYKGLTSLGYHAPFGQNTFTRTGSDQGMSSYLRHRMFDGWQYKGFGISAQSMSANGISYSVGKNTGELRISPLLETNTFEAQEFYSLPKAEMLSKFIAISGYSGAISLSGARRIYGPNFDRDYKDILDFMLAKGFAIIYDDNLRFTEEGFKIYGPLLSLFHISLEKDA